MQMTEAEPKPGKKRSFLATMTAILWSFIGLRRKRDYEHDAEHLNPVYVIIAALLATVAFIGILVMLVKYAVTQ
jgi:hypothetical protein